MLRATKDLPKISYHCCVAIEKICSACEPTYPEQETNSLSVHYKQIFDHLEVNGDRADFNGSGCDLTQTSYVTMTALVQSSCTNTH